jgi:hypothetical protein
MTEAAELDHTFEAPIGVEVKGDLWSCVEVPGAAELLGTRKSVRVDATVDEVELKNIGLMPTGAGGLMLSLSAKVRKQLGKDVGDTVKVELVRRLT